MYHTASLISPWGGGLLPLWSLLSSMQSAIHDIARRSQFVNIAASPCEKFHLSQSTPIVEHQCATESTLPSLFFKKARAVNLDYILVTYCFISVYF